MARLKAIKYKKMNKKRGGKTMKDEHELYRALQKHLDKQTLGFPATKSGADIRVLKALFTPEQAERATRLTYRYESLEQIYQRARGSGRSIEEMERILDETAARGVIGRKNRNGTKQYRNIPYLVGMAEGGLALNPTPEFVAAHTQYAEEGSFAPPTQTRPPLSSPLT
jgi:hypothetical protein